MCHEAVFRFYPQNICRLRTVGRKELYQIRLHIVESSHLDSTHCYQQRQMKFSSSVSCFTSSSFNSMYCSQKTTLYGSQTDCARPHGRVCERKCCNLRTINLNFNVEGADGLLGILKGSLCQLPLCAPTRDLCNTPHDISICLSVTFTIISSNPLHSKSLSSNSIQAFFI